jgi:hypothetical protein
MGNIRLNQSLIYKTMGKEHREFIVPLFLCNWMVHMPLLHPIKRRVFCLFLSLHHPNNRLENTYNFYLHLINSVAKNLFWRRKKNFNGICITLQPPTYACGTHGVLRNGDINRPRLHISEWILVFCSNNFFLVFVTKILVLSLLTTLYGETLLEQNSDLVRWLREISNTDTGYETVLFSWR